MSCCLCQELPGNFLCLKNCLNGDEGKICFKCYKKDKLFCSLCGIIDFAVLMIWDFENLTYCNSCFAKSQQKVCACGCGVMAIFYCSCNYYFARKCAEIHFLKSRPQRHYFYLYKQKRYLPDFNSADEIYDKFDLASKATTNKYNKMSEFYLEIFNLYRQSKKRDDKVIKILLNSLSLSGYFRASDYNFDNDHSNTDTYENFTYYGSDKDKLKIKKFQFQTNEYYNSLDIIRIKTVLKYRRLDKNSRKTFRAKKLKYSIFNDLTPSISLLKAITIYFELTKNKKHITKFINYVKIHFQDCPELGRLYFIKAKQLQNLKDTTKKGDFNRADNYFTKSLEILGRNIELPSFPYCRVLYHYARNLYLLKEFQKSHLVLLQIISKQSPEDFNGLLKKSLNLLLSFPDLHQPLIDHISKFLSPVPPSEVPSSPTTSSQS